MNEQISTVENKESQKITFIHKDLNFYRNSLNLLVGKRGSGKTFNVIREVIKVGLLPDKANYTTFVIVSDKDNDSTINEQKSRINLKILHTNYDNATKLLNDIKEGKTAYDEVISNNLENKLTNNSSEEIKKRCGVAYF
jgi:uncharacterized protein YbcC (UPF0753/DUF2309 family)